MLGMAMRKRSVSSVNLDDVCVKGRRFCSTLSLLSAKTHPLMFKHFHVRRVRNAFRLLCTE